jgi:hypothetical protein
MHHRGQPMQGMAELFVIAAAVREARAIRFPQRADQRGKNDHVTGDRLFQSLTSGIQSEVVIGNYSTSRLREQHVCGLAAKLLANAHEDNADHP